MKYLYLTRFFRGTRNENAEFRTTEFLYVPSTWFLTMKSIKSADIPDSFPLKKVQDILDEHPIQFAILFGSYATGDTHERSDVDIAIEFQSVNRTEPEYNDEFFGLSADLSDELETNNVDLVDVQNVSPGVAKAILEEGVLIVGDRANAENVLKPKADSSSETRTPRERIDTALGKINEHLGTDSAVAASEDLSGDR